VPPDLERVRPNRGQRRAAVADALGLVAFVTVGLLSHDHTLGLRGYARDLLPLLAGWFVVAALFRLYRGGGRLVLLATWLVGVPLGVGIRALVLGRSPDGKEAAFLGVALAFTGLFVLAFRAALTRRPARAAPSPRRRARTRSPPPGS
jgi:hypothetical protein